MKKKIIIAFSIFFILIVLCVVYLNFENTKLQVSNYDIIDNDISDEFNGFKILQISDFHNTKSKVLVNDLVDEINRQKPSIIVITGDFIDSYKTNIDIAINFIKKINNVAPIYFVSGNHEARISDYVRLKEEMVNNKVIILENETEVLELNGFQLNLIGLDDPAMVHDLFVADGEIIKGELNNVEYDKENYSVLLSHRPELFNVYVENGIDLVLTGHAHGGQIRIPFIGGLVAPNQGFFPKYTSGKFEENKTTMIVSRGIGNSILPLRINNRPELVVVNLSNE